MTLSKWVGVLGTHGWPSNPKVAQAEWWHPLGPLATFLRTQGVEPARPDKPFVWSGDLEGIPLLASGRDWEAGAESLFYYLDGLPYESRNVIAHSHGGQVALLAAASGLKMRALILVGTPVRKDIERNVAPRAVEHIGVCRHLYDPRWDTMGMAGALFDFRLSLRRKFQVPGIVSETVKGMGHSGVLCNPELFGLWVERGWLDLIRGVWSPAAAGVEET